MKLESSDLVATVREVAEDYSEDRYYGDIPTGEYDAGYYLMYGRTSCIMGIALEKLGVSNETLLKYENKKASKIVKDLFKKYTMSDLLWLDTVQRKHDTNHSYSDSVQLADTLFTGV